DSISGDSVGAANAAKRKTGQVLSAYGVLNIPNSKVALIARVDNTDPNTLNDATTSTDKVTRFIGGVSYQLSTNLRLLADIDAASIQGGKYTNAQNATRTTAYFQTQISF
ncbi:MAG: hypothetical protein ABI765_16325, partial [Gemmatimonadota bacterium]